MIVKIRVTPGASRNEIVREGENLLVRVTARPQEGKANAAALELLHEYFGKPVKIVAGHKARSKVIEVAD
jgi:hypothetical protein